MSSIRVTFFGSSVDGYPNDTTLLFECLYAVYDEVIVINGGYQGTMREIPEIGKNIAKSLNKSIYIQGILFDGYKNDPSNSEANQPNTISDSQVSFTNIGDRVQAMVELAEIVIVLPGRTGTLHEIFQVVETLQYGMNYSDERENFRRLFVHSNWSKTIESLFQNGNMSSKVYNYLKENLYSFNGKKDKKKEQLIQKLISIPTIQECNEEIQLELINYPIKIFASTEKHFLDIRHQLSKVIVEINKSIYGKYFDKEKGNKVVGLDIALKESDKRDGKLFGLESIGTSTYLRTLNDFLNKYRSVIDNAARVNKWFSIQNVNVSDTKEIFYHDHKNKSSFVGEDEGTIDDWVKSLENNKLGKVLYWTSIKHERYHISAFLVLDAFLSESLRNKLEKVVNQFLLEYMLVESAEEYIKSALDSSFKSAISDIINRNMAHHITSHVSNRATLDKVLERLGNDTDDKKTAFLSDKRNYNTVLDLLNRFNQYRDERSEYLTYITNFSSPSSAYFFQDVIRPFVENTLLMDNIAANENINYGNADTTTSNKLRIKVCLKDTEEVYKPLLGTYVKRNKQTGEIESKFYTSEDFPYLRLKETASEYQYDDCILSIDDIEVSLPGTLGKHALYSILENFIRNSAKHGGKIKNIQGLDIILLMENKEDVLDVILTDNCSEIKDEDGKIKIDVDSFNKSIRTPILERKDLGLIDMKVNACLLAGELLSDENCMKQNVFQTIDYKNKLAYKFKIAKPKKAVFIGEFTKEVRLNKGFYYFKTIEEYRKSDIHKSFQFAILSDNLYDQQRVEIGCELPARILKYSEVEKDKTENIGHLYEVWLKKMRGNEAANVHVFFEQNDNTEPTKEFKAKYKEHQNLKVYSNEDLSEGLTIIDNKNVFFDRHGGLIGKFSKDKSLVDTNHSWILIDKNNPDFDYISRYDIINKTNLLVYELEEAGLLKVLVIDERIAEQSIRMINDTDQAIKLREEQRSDFWKWEKQNSKFNLTLFDLAWASNVFLATHLGENALKQKINQQTEHCLKVKFNMGKIELETNIPSNSACRINQKWNDKKTGIEISNSQSETISIKPDIMIIHRTKLKELLTANSKFVKELLNENEGISLVVTTGSGTTHGIEGDYKILPFATLSKLLLAKRVNKLQLSKMLLELTKNKI